MSPTKHKLWTPGFIILWFGQLVSTLGDAAYSVALGFWVLDTTGSTSLMGLLMASSTLPGVIVSPFAGVLIDRCNKKWVIVLMDMIRGVAIVAVAWAAFSDRIAMWMVFTAGVILSICGAIFKPGMSSSVPDMVDKSKLTQANSMFSIVSTGANMVGNVSGSVIYYILGAPILFLFNSLSYLFSGFAILFVKIKHNKDLEKPHFWADMTKGFKFMWNLKGLRFILLLAAVINFFSFVAIVLFLPFFQSTDYLGAVKYGVAMACFMGGATAGFLCSSIITIPPRRKLTVFTIAAAITNISMILAVYQTNFTNMIVFVLLGGFFNSIVSVILVSTVQAATPRAMRGKVMAFMNMTTQGLTPFAMALGGMLGGIFPIKSVIAGSFLIIGLIILPFCFVKPFEKFMNEDYELDRIKELIEQ